MRPCMHPRSSVSRGTAEGRLSVAGWAAVLGLVLAGPAHPQAAGGCNCFPPEVQAQTAQEALQKSTLAVYGRVLEVGAVGGPTRLVVMESFKGPSKGTVIVVQPASTACTAPSSAAGEELLLLAFEEVPTACDLHPREHYLLGAFRSAAAGRR